MECYCQLKRCSCQAAELKKGRYRCTRNKIKQKLKIKEEGFKGPAPAKKKVTT
jgi:hypothetical protein